MRRIFHRHHERSGVALVTTVIVVAVLAVVAVAFMQSTSMDRLSSRTVRNYFAARLAAEAASSLAAGQLARLVARYPDSVTVWQNIGGTTTNEATVLYVRALATNTNSGARPGQFGPEVTFLAQPLVSGGTLQSLTNIGKSMPYALGDTNMVNLNATNSGQPEPWVGFRSTILTNTNVPVRADGAPVAAAQWVYLGQSPGPISATNPPIARYAYWIEDESFKVNVNFNRAGGRVASNLGTNAGDLSINGVFSNARGLINLRFENMVNERSRMPGSNFPTALTAAFPLELPATNAAEMRFLTTSMSAGLDLSRGGFKRFNINTVTNGIAGPTDANNIRTSLNRIIAAITNSNSVPNFGQRFYRLNASAAGVNATNAVTNTHTNICLQKIAANILDYVDADSQPTVVLNDPPTFNILSGAQDLAASSRFFNEGIGGEGTNRIAAMGVESRPFLQGYAIAVQLTNMTPVGFNSTNPPANREARFGMLIDHYFEFWNPSSRDIVVGTGTDTNLSYIENLSLQLGNAPGWIDKSTGTRFAEPGTKDFKADFAAGTRFPANQVTLVTTAPIADASRFAPSAQNIVSIYSTALDAMRSVSGVTKDVFTTNSSSFPLFNRFFGVSLNFRNAEGSQIDFETEMLLGSSFGAVEMFPALTLNSQRIWALSNNAVFTNRSTLFGNLRSGAPDGPAPRSTEGDPRTLMEQLQLQPVATGSTENPNQTRLFVDNVSPIGTPNSTYVRPTDWVDYSSFASGSANAPMIVRNSAMTSIGEMGNLIDSARVPGIRGAGTPSLTNAIYARSGGRTLRVGQPEHPRWYEYSNLSTGVSVGVQTNASRTWTSWRLADVFTTKTNLSLPGLVNPNGMLRDNGMVFRAMLNQFKFQPSPEGAPSTAPATLALTNVNNLVTNALARMTNTNGWTPAGAVNPFWERGEISELSAFNSASNPLGINMSNTFDRGREEIVRRSIEMITTRGSIFSAYVIAQSLQVTPTATNVLSTARLKTTFEIIPQFAATGAFSDDFNPGDASAIQTRFARPTNYQTRVLSSFYE
jgi:hypothetical protein